MNNTILVVDDNPKNLQVIAALLSDHDYQVEVALSGIDALKWLEDHAFDAILLDVMMPDMNGFETCKKIKQYPVHGNVPVIFLTARHDIESITKGFDAGGVDFLTKPFNHKELLVRLGTHIELKRSREQLIDVNELLNTQVEEKTVELRESNQKLAEANKNLENLDVAKNDFLTAISHELRTPLNGIVGSINLLKELTHDKYIQEVVSVLDSSVNNLEKYSYAALLISNLQLKGDSQLKLEKIELLSLIKSITADFAEKVKLEELSCSMISNCSRVIVVADRELLKNAIKGLLDISLIFTKKGYININIEKNKDKVSVDIEDTGSSYESKALNHYFRSLNNQNYTFKRNNAMELFMVQTIILHHKGSLYFRNKKDESGTVTGFVLPCLISS